MFSVRNLFVIGAVSLIGGIILVSGDVSQLPEAKVLNSAGGPNSVPPVTEVCLGCICEAVSNCNLTLQCNGDVCGLFRITWAYWSDAGKPTQNNVSPDSDSAYANCVNEPFCAARAVQGYMNRFAQDCNGDGQINCYDYAAIHKIGGYGCKNNPMPEDYKNKLNACLDNVRKFQG